MIWIGSPVWYDRIYHLERNAWLGKSGVVWEVILFADVHVMWKIMCGLKICTVWKDVCS